MLKAAGYINMLIAAGHVIGLIWAWPMFRVTGCEKDMLLYAAIHPSLPYLLTILVAFFFFMFGLYALSAAGAFKKLPYIKTTIYFIAGIYILRGIAGFAIDLTSGINAMLEAIYSGAALVIGLMYLYGGLRKWQFPK